MTRRRRSRARTALFVAILVLGTALAVEAIAFLSLLVLAKTRHLEYDPVPVDELLPKQVEFIERMLAGEVGLATHSPRLGWETRANHTGRHGTNAQGLRASRVWPAEKAPGTIRIATFGDSFTFGYDSALHATFQERLMEMDPRLEVLNFGVPGYGLDQAFLRYEERADGFDPDVVLVGYLTENVFRNVNTFRPFYYYRSGLPLAKPRYLLAGEGLALAENPLPSLDDYRELLARPADVLPRIGRHDYFFRSKLRAGPADLLATVRLVKLARATFFPKEPIVTGGFYNTAGEGYQVTARLFDRFHDAVVADGAVPVMVVFPTRAELVRLRDEGSRRYQPLLDHFTARGELHVDALDAFERYGKDVKAKDLVRNHYTHLGNRLLAQYLHDELVRMGLVPPREGDAGE